MQLKSIHQIILLLGGIFFCQLSQATPASQASIDQLFKVLQIKENTQAMIKPQELKLLGLDKESYWNNIEPQLKELYKNNLSEEELQALNRFYQTPEGRSLSEKMPQLSQQTYKIVIKNMMSNSNISKGLFNMLGIQP
ncbi:DUF2059 domain-containing protein [Acinetobacter sp. ESL0695]|jgi:uncharacterized protein|uniref:DUF2059 domain-containing protein n=1 Tax=Acinetobacter pollinis TaxID=2605270 RepID=A0ABU6DP56_9GAMM|nr:MULTISPECIES: DUF2059 domain-containing protein [Acinetobacter]MEB5475495.1 DUF2059 domain-containing protein [Acinetobacter pollinis]WEV48506.1 DUF2059 domain-containing protein [Acinetobacter sp. ESL0695]